MIRVSLNKERMNLGSANESTVPQNWDNEMMRIKGRTPDIIHRNKHLNNIEADLEHIFHKLEYTDNLSLELIKTNYKGPAATHETIMDIFRVHNDDIKVQIGITKSSATLQKYENCRRHFESFLKEKFNRCDLYLNELKPLVIHDFEIYLLSVAKCSPNTSTKMLKTLKTITIFAIRSGFLGQDPFLNTHFHLKPTDRGFLTDEEIAKLMRKDMGCNRLNQVRDIFIFSCFTGLAYIDVANLKKNNLVELDDKVWIMTHRKKTDVPTNIILMDIPKAIIKKYSGQSKDEKLLPILSNQKMNAYLKEIGAICKLEKKLTFHLARHTFATMSLSKGVPIETVSKMLGHTNIKTTQIYARITNKKVENDMMELSTKLSKFDALAEKMF
jgi:site-specific recombinase XerD